MSLDLLKERLNTKLPVSETEMELDYVRIYETSILSIQIHDLYMIIFYK